MKQRKTTSISAQPKPIEWRNRIVSHGQEDPEKLLANPKNWRLHPKYQQEVLAGSLDEIGWVDEITVNRLTGFVTDGHARVALAISRGEKSVPTRYVELTEEEEALILAAKDPIGSLAVPDLSIFGDLVSGISVSNEVLSGMLYSFLDDANASSLKDVPSADGDGSESADRNLGDKQAVKVKPVLYVSQIAVLERALCATGNANRGEALIEICNAYLKQKPEGQFDIPTESIFAGAGFARG